MNDAIAREIAARGSRSPTQLRLLLEELCCDLCRFEHARSEGVAPGAVEVDREVFMGTPGSFADIRVRDRLVLIQFLTGHANGVNAGCDRRRSQM